MPIHISISYLYIDTKFQNVCYDLKFTYTNVTYPPHWVDNFHHTLPQGPN